MKNLDKANLSHTLQRHHEMHLHVCTLSSGDEDEFFGALKAYILITFAPL